VDLTFTPAQQDLRSDIRQWLARNAPSDGDRTGDFAAVRKFDMDWQRTQFEGGWAGIAWPSEYGGRGLTLVEQLIWYEEYARANAPAAHTSFVGINHAGPTLVMRGSENQRQCHLPKILSGQEVWCQGFSEPEAGSDLGSVRTRGVLDGDSIVVSGQKIWTSYAWGADYQELLVRTNPSAPKHKGLSWLICPMNLPGIDVWPIRTMAGDDDFCEVFYDNVRIPSENVVGDIDSGWEIAMTTLSFERGSAFMSEQVALSNLLTELANATNNVDGAGSLDDLEFRRRFARLRAEVTALRAMTYMGVSRSLRAGHPGPEGSYLRLAVGELMQRICRLAMDVLGAEGLAWTNPIRHQAQWSNDYLYSFSRTISAGTKDIQRNVIGERILGLPR